MRDVSPVKQRKFEKLKVYSAAAILILDTLAQVFPREEHQQNHTEQASVTQQKQSTTI